jgi:hypothetical protein
MNKELLVLSCVFCTILGACVGFIIGQYPSDVVIDYSDDQLYEQRLDSMDLVVNEMFPVGNQTVVLMNMGFVSSVYDWENNSKLSEGGWIIHVNHSYYGESDFLFDGWELYEYEGER